MATPQLAPPSKPAPTRQLARDKRTENMSTNSQRSASAAGAREKTYFEQQREALIAEIAMVPLLTTLSANTPSE